MQCLNAKTATAYVASMVDVLE